MRPNDFMAAFQTKVIPNLFSQLRHTVKCLLGNHNETAGSNYLYGAQRKRLRPYCIYWSSQKFTVVSVLNIGYKKHYSTVIVCQLLLSAVVVKVVAAEGKHIRALPQTHHSLWCSRVKVFIGVNSFYLFILLH